MLGSGVFSFNAAIRLLPHHLPLQKLSIVIGLKQIFLLFLDIRTMRPVTYWSLIILSYARLDGRGH
jgi:hypothetical protein